MMKKEKKKKKKEKKKKEKRNFPVYITSMIKSV
jgi:hypothetical protein